MLHFWDAIQTPHYEVQTFLVCTSSLTPQSPTLHCLKQLVLPQPVAPLALPQISPSGPLSPSHLRNCQLSRPGSVPSCLSHESKVSNHPSRSPWLCGFIFLFINSIHTKREPTRCPALGPLRTQDEFRCPSFQGNHLSEGLHVCDRRPRTVGKVGSRPSRTFPGERACDKHLRCKAKGIQLL